MKISNKPIWGIDLGGTKVEGIIMRALGKPEVIERIRIPTERENGYEHVLGRIKHLLEMLSEKSGLKPEKIGIGTPGTLDPITELLKNSNTTILNDKPFKKDLEGLIDIPVKIANDANCFALAEATFGAVRVLDFKPQVVFGVILGTGVGGGLVVDGKVINGRQGIGGEWGHNFLDESGGQCYCGKTGCVETIISGTALEKFYSMRSGSALPLQEIVERYEAGNDLEARATMGRLVKYFGKAISVVIDIVDPDVVILGGGVGNISQLYTEGVDWAGKFVFNNRLDTMFIRPSLGDSAGVFGAALLATE